MGHPVVHFEVHSQHSEALRSFYSELFGWKLESCPTGASRWWTPMPAARG